MATPSSASSSEVSDLLDVTYEQIHSILSGQILGVSPKKLKAYITPRLENLKSLSHPFRKPSEASRKQVGSGNVALGDGVVLRVDDTARDMAYAISDSYQICEIQALVLYRSFLFNNGLSLKDDTDQAALAEELVQKMTPFYFSERLSILRILASLRAQRDDPSLRFHQLAVTLSPTLFPEGRQYATSLLDEYKRRGETKLQDRILRDRRTAAYWAKQWCREQVILLEILFWDMWTVACDGPLLEGVMGAAFESEFGNKQPHPTLLLDDEAAQIQEDIAGLWTLITIEILELETLVSVSDIEISETPSNTEFYVSFPQSLLRVHNLITSNATRSRLCTYVAWTFVVTRLATSAIKLKQIPASYRPFLETILSSRESSQAAMKALSFEAENDLFGVMHNFLTQSSIFVTIIAQRTGSVISEPNTLAYRAVLKGLLISIVELSPVEMIPDFDGLVEVWVDLFGRSESRSITSICRQFWDWDWNSGIARRAIFDVARSRFPVQPRSLLRLLRSMTASGFLDTDPLSSENIVSDADDRFAEDRESCKSSVFRYLNTLHSYTMVVPSSAISGPHAIFEKYGTPSAYVEITYRNVVDIGLPGGSVLTRNSVARILSGDGADPVVLSWKHEHSGWRLLLDILAEFTSGDSPRLGPARTRNRNPHKDLMMLSLQDVGFEADGSMDEGLVTPVLDLFRSVMHGSPERVGGLLQLLESPQTGRSGSQPPHLVELTTTVLEDALSRAGQSRQSAPTHLITSALGVLSSILPVPTQSRNVWIYIRYSTMLFGSERSAAFSSTALAAERLQGHYPMTLALLQLAQQLFREALVLQDPEDQEAKSLQMEVLLRTLRFVHTQIWVEHQGWKYAHLSDRFEISRRIASLYADVLHHTPENIDEGSFPALSRALLDLWLYKSVSSTVNPLVSSLSTGGQLVQLLTNSRHFADSRRLILLLKSHLRLTRLVLQLKRKLPTISTRPLLLEQVLCTRVAGVLAPSPGTAREDIGPIDVLAAYVIENNADPDVRLEAIRVLTSLCSSLSNCQPPPTTVVGHLSKPEAVVTTFVRIVQHAYDDISLRHAIWSFMSLAMDKEPALASLLVSGEFLIPADAKGKAPAASNDERKITALSVAKEFLAAWEQLWDANPRSLAAALEFLHIIWQHGLEHKASLDETREDGEFWRHTIAVVCAELGPPPDFETNAYRDEDGVRRAEHHSLVCDHAYRTSAKAHAIQILGLDIGIQLHNRPRDGAPVRPLSLAQMEPKLKSEEELNDLLLEAAPNSYRPELYDQVAENMNEAFPGLTPGRLQIPEPVEEREFGDDFAFSVPMLRDVLHNRQTTDGMEDPLDEAEKQLFSLNLNLSLMHTQKSLADAWSFLLTKLTPFMRGDTGMVANLLSIATTVSYDVSREDRQGDMAASIHGSRLSFILSILELAWFSPIDKPPELKSFAELAENVKNIILNEHQSPIASILCNVTVPFHRLLLQLVYFCAKFARLTATKSSKLTAEARLKISTMIETALGFVIEALRVVFVAALGRHDQDLDEDMELLGAVFQQCTRPDINPTSSVWLAKCQETDVVKASLELFVRVDFVGLANLPQLTVKKQALYVPHLLLFHTCLASLSTSAERLATEGFLAAYSNNTLTNAISSGQIDTTIPELPGMRSPAHEAYCSMLSIVSAVVSAMGMRNHHFDAEACGFVQLYGGQIVRALSWTTDSPITLAFLEELEQVINLFYAIAESAPLPPRSSPAVDKVLSVFSPLALRLLQQLSYATSHPNQLASLFDPVTSDERALVEKDSPAQDVLKRPLVTHLMHRVYRLSNGILKTLISITRAEEVLLTEQDVWPTKQALLIPHAKVVPDEPASIGTLLELSGTACDLLTGLANRPAGQSMGTAGAATSDVAAFAPLTVRDGVITARGTLESALMYAATQLAMWVSKPEFDEPEGVQHEMDMEEDMQHSTRSDERMRPRPSVVMISGRLNSGMVAAMVTDLEDMMRRARDVLKKTEGMTGKDSIDLTPILGRFLHERIRTHATV